MIVTTKKQPLLVSALLVLGFLFVGFILGNLVSSTPWQFMVALGIAPAVLVVAWRNVFCGFFLYFMFLMFSPFLKLSDIVTFIFMVLYIVKYLNSPCRTFDAKAYGNIFKLLSLFLAWCVLSIILGKFWFQNTFDYIYRDSRVLAYWLWLPILMGLLSSGVIRKNSIQNLIVLIGLSVACLALIQFFTGTHLLGKGRVSELNAGEDVVRVQIYGFIFVTLTLVITVAKLASGGARAIFLIPMLLLSIVGLYVNFGRAVWTWAAVGVCLLFFFLPLQISKKLMPRFLIFVIIGIGAIYAIRPSAVERAIDRIASVQQEGGRSTSYGWRKLENQDGLSAIKNSPVFGVGLGGEYRRWIAEIREFEDHTRYIHNVYLFYAVKIGIPGSILFIVLLINIWLIAVRTSRTAEESDQRYFAVAVSAALPAFFMLNITQPELEEPFGVIYLILILCGLYCKPSLSQTKLNELTPPGANK